jgi:hypothetical protein
MKMMTIEKFLHLPVGVEDAVRTMLDLKAFNILIGNDGSVEITKNHEIILSKTLLQGKAPSKSITREILDWILEVAPKCAPNGLHIPNPDLELSIFTLTLPAGALGLPGVDDIKIGIYGRSVSPEATSKGGYIIMKPTYQYRP